jgi:hypothetical protein
MDVLHVELQLVLQHLGDGASADVEPWVGQEDGQVVCLISEAAISMAGVLSDELNTSSGRLEGCPGSRAKVGRTALFAAFACSRTGDGHDGVEELAGGVQRDCGLRAVQVRALCLGSLHTRQ